MNQPLLQVQGISKRFSGVHALKSVDLTLDTGEVLAVVGENGAGKSTLMKILAGVQTPDEGSIQIDGQTVSIDSCRQAMNYGIVLIHQELNLADNLDVGANVFLGREPGRWGWMNKPQMHAESAKYLKMVGLDIDPRTLVRDLSIGKQQMIEIAKALSVGARVLIMDEPTSSLSSKEADRLFEVVDDLSRQGVSVIYISHRLGEVKRLANRATVLRDGQNAGELAQEEINHSNLVRYMVGRDLSQFYARKEATPGSEAFEVIDLVTPEWPEKKLSFSLRSGEIVGVAGLVGAGRTEMLQAVFGVQEPLAGKILLEGQEVVIDSPQDAIAAGMALVPEDRKQHGLVLEMSVRENISLAGLKRNALPGGFLNRTQEDAETRRMTTDMRIKTPDAEQAVQYLSGGNQQKVVIGKWLAMNPRVLLMDEPTRGIDVGAKQEIYELMERLAEQGVAILFVSSEMEEILGMSDRALVMHEGAISGQLQRSELSEEAVMHLATGGALEASID